MGLVALEVSNGIAQVSFRHPPVNALNREMGKQLGEVVDEVAERDDVYAVILTGEGKKAFIAGGDIKEFPSYQHPNIAEDVMLEFHRTLTSLHNLPMPTIAAICGHALGGGCEVALACDFRIMERQCHIGLPEITLGIFPGAGGTQRLPRLIGEAQAKRLILSGKPVTADEARRMGLVDEVADEGTGLERAVAFAAPFESLSRVAMRRAKHAIQEGLNLPLAEGLKLEARLFGEAFDTEDAQEGVQAFMERRKPQFRHR